MLDYCTVSNPQTWYHFLYFCSEFDKAIEGVALLLLVVLVAPVWASGWTTLILFSKCINIHSTLANTSLGGHAVLWGLGEGEITRVIILHWLSTQLIQIDKAAAEYVWCAWLRSRLERAKRVRIWLLILLPKASINLWLESSSLRLIWVAREGWHLRLLESHIVLLAELTCGGSPTTTHTLALVHGTHIAIAEALSERVGLESLFLLLRLLHPSKRLLLLTKTSSAHRLLLLAGHILHTKGVSAHLIIIIHLLLLLETRQTSYHWLESLLLLLLLLLWLSLPESTHQAALVLLHIITRSHHTIKRRILIIGWVCVWVVHLIQILNINSLLGHICGIVAALHVYGCITIPLKITKATIIITSSSWKTHLIILTSSGLTTATKHVHEISWTRRSTRLLSLLRCTIKWKKVWSLHRRLTRSHNFLWLTCNLLRHGFLWLSRAPVIVTGVFGFFLGLNYFLLNTLRKVFLPILHILLKLFWLVFIEPCWIMGPFFGVGPLLLDVFILEEIRNLPITSIRIWLPISFWHILLPIRVY